MNYQPITRPGLLTGSALCGGLILVDGTQILASGFGATESSEDSPAPAISAASTRRLPDLAPGQWIWYPSGRTLPNTFILFRREVNLAARPRRAVGWIAADSRYRLKVNGKRIQFGPAPADPRWADADPVDLTAVLREGRNVVGATVLFYGLGDGTCPLGKAGFLFRLEIEDADGRKQTIVSDASWRALLCRAWQPGHYKRWYLRPSRKSSTRGFTLTAGASRSPRRPRTGWPQCPCTAHPTSPPWPRPPRNTSSIWASGRLRVNFDRAAFRCCTEAHAGSPACGVALARVGAPAPGIF